MVRTATIHFLVFSLPFNGFLNGFMATLYLKNQRLVNSLTYDCEGVVIETQRRLPFGLLFLPPLCADVKNVHHVGELQTHIPKWFQLHMSYGNHSNSIRPLALHACTPSHITILVFG